MTLTVNYFTLSMSESLTDDSDYTIFNEIKQNTLKLYNYNDLTDDSDFKIKNKIKYNKRKLYNYKDLTD